MTATNITVKRVCEFCGKEFISQKITTRFCSKECNNKAYKLRLRQTHVKQSENKAAEKPLAEIKNKEYLSVNEAAVVLGLSRKSAYNLIYKGILKATRFSNRLTIIKRSDIETMFENGKPYQKLKKEAPAPITLFYTTKEIMAKYKVCESQVYHIAKKTTIPKEIKSGRVYWSQRHVDAYFRKYTPDANIKDWYSVKDIMDKYSMTKTAVYTLVSNFKVPKKKEGCATYYSKVHIDKIKGK